MSTLNPVRPGDLITAAGWNQLISDLLSLEARVAALESGPTGPVITSTSPSGQITVPSLLTIVGRNFVTPVNGQNTVSIEGATIDTFIVGSNETMLIIDLPTFAGLPKTVQMTVSNRYGTSAPFPLQLAPARFRRPPARPPSRRSPRTSERFRRARCSRSTSTSRQRSTNPRSSPSSRCSPTPRVRRARPTGWARRRSSTCRVTRSPKTRSACPAVMPQPRSASPSRFPRTLAACN